MPSKAKPAPKPAASPTGDIPLHGPALELWNETTGKWDLDGPARRLLRIACESVQRANECQAILDRDGLTLADRYGNPAKHPACLMLRDFHAAAAGALAKLGMLLGD